MLTQGQREHMMQVIKWGLDVAENAMTETNRIAALSECKGLLNELMQDAIERRKHAHSQGLEA
jgi:hypothetical protein